MRQATAMMGLTAETSIHAGTGQMVGVIDLPIQRESHTGWPCVYGSAVKGALRTKAEGKDAKLPDWIDEVFGPPPRPIEGSTPSEHSGALAVGDARLLLLPVRSLTTHFKWVTCPALLRRFKNDCVRLSIACNITIPTQLLSDTEAFVNEPAAANQSLFLEEFSFTQQHQDLSTIRTELIKIMDRDDADSLLSKQLVIVSDDIFKHLSRYGIPVNPHIAIKNETKTTRKGALWYEETLPSETLLYVPLVAQKSRKESSSKKPDEVLDHVLTDLFPATSPYLQLGGNETVGMGWCKVKTVKGGA